MQSLWVEAVEMVSCVLDGIGAKSKLMIMLGFDP